MLASIRQAAPRSSASALLYRSVSQSGASGFRRHVFKGDARCYATTTSSLPAEHIAFSTSANNAHDDALVREIFDSPEAWKAFSKKSFSGSGKRTGLFLYKYLTDPEAFPVFAERTLQRSSILCDKIVAARTPAELRSVIKDFDRLSDMMCCVIDLSEFIRTAHPDPQFVEAAEQAYAIMYKFMNQLNTNVGLYQTLLCVFADKAISADLSEEERAVGMIFIRDFEKAGIHLSPKTRGRFVSLASEIDVLGRRFVTGAGAKEVMMKFDAKELYGLNPDWAREYMSRDKKSITIPSRSTVAQLALQTVHSGDVRKKIYEVMNAGTAKQVDTLENMLRSRAELARLTGHEDYATMQLQDKMASKPASVLEFLESLAASNLPLAQKEQGILEKLKQDQLQLQVPSGLKAWDRSYYAAKYYQQQSRSVVSLYGLSDYFSVGTVIQGLSRLFTQLYGIRFVPRETQQGETWHEDVRRLDVVCEKEGHVGLIYCDLFARRGKTKNPAHYTVRCSRRIDDDIPVEGDIPEDTGMATMKDSVTGQIYQLPTIALLCAFENDGRPGPTLLHFNDLKTLFHEMGHAMHTMLGRTSFQSVCGTRCATDFVELPSVLMEHFVSAPEVLKLCARHYKTDASAPPELIEAQDKMDKLQAASESQMQIVMSLLDQHLHSSIALQSGFDSTAVWHGLETQWGLYPPVPGTRWQTQMSHLAHYGGTYYSYVFDRAIASKVWKTVFASNPVDRSAGERFRGEVLKWGGGRNPWTCIEGVLGAEGEGLGKGDSTAMEKVGSWGIELD
ncbi:Mitochondrial intermediate peptidase [Saitoella coloradoensis]